MKNKKATNFFFEREVEKCSTWAPGNECFNTFGERLLTPEETAKFLGTTKEVLSVWRQKKRFPTLQHIKIGKKVMYSPNVVACFIKSNTI